MSQQPPPKVQVAGTNDYSILSKASIVAKGYVVDPYLHWFVGQQEMAKARRSPIINRGYYVRHRAMEWALKREFSKHASSCSSIVISLGAGFDTSALRYHKSVTLFIELDYPTVCQRKAAILESRKADLPFECSAEELVFDEGAFNSPSSNGPFVISPKYLLLGVDLRQSEEVVKVLADERVSEAIFTAVSKSFSDIRIVFLNECSLCYIAQKEADVLLKAVAFHFIRSLERRCVGVTYIGYEMLASKYNTEEYGRFLLRHFESLGAPILTFLGESQIRDRFCRPQLGLLKFDRLQLINMKTFWREQLKDDETERERLRALEPFDEFEELDCVSASYTLTVAERGIHKGDWTHDDTLAATLAKSIEGDPTFLQRTGALPHPAFHRIDPHWPIGQHENLLGVFGHASHYDAEKCLLRIFGGFGHEPTVDGASQTPSVAGHRRFRRIVEFQLSRPPPPSPPHQAELENGGWLYLQFEWLHLKPYTFTPRLLEAVADDGSDTAGQAINRVYAQVVSLAGGSTHYLLSGGRASPTTVQPSALIEIDESAPKYRLTPIPSLNQPVPHQGRLLSAQAYRHVCARFGSSDEVIQFGGITPQCEATAPNGSVFLFDINSNFAVRTSTVRRFNTQRHSAAFTTYKDEHFLIVNGGLDLATDGFEERFTPLEVIDRREMVAHQFPFKSAFGIDFPLLYGHRMQMINEWDLLVVGGIGQECIENAVFRVDMRTMAIKSITRLYSKSATLMMLQNHTTELIADPHNIDGDPRLCVIGGGGNCFSFGTHFNPIFEYAVPKYFVL